MKPNLTIMKFFNGRSILGISWVLYVFLISSCTPPPIADDRQDRARQVISKMMDEKNIAGFAITIIQDGETVWSEGFGYANLELEVPVDPEKTMFRIGSVSKTFTAIGAARLFQKGSLDLQADARSYVPYFPEKRYPFTVAQVAGHNSGIRHYSGDPNEYASKRRYKSVEESLSIFMEDSLLFEPGTQHRYSSFGYNTMSAIIEGASGQNFIDYIQEEIFDVAGLLHTSADFTDSIIVGRSGHYEFDSAANKLVNTVFVDNSYKWAGGGFLSSSADIARLGWAWHTNQIVADTVKQLFLTDQQLKNGKFTSYGLGWDLYDDLIVPSYGHGGTAVGGKATLRVLPEYNMVIGIATNMWKIQYREELQEIVKIFLGMEDK